MLTKEFIAETFQRIQDSICTFLEAEDGSSSFVEDNWSRPEGGGGRTRVMEYGQLIEKGGVNFSAVHGETPPQIKASFGYDASRFFATGVSLVLHPVNPFVPIVHMNIRYFELDDKNWWFGGGIDMTPHYIDIEKASFFHEKLKEICDDFDPVFYVKFKTWADDYFYLKHRDETRGIGGIFFDRLHEPLSKEKLFEFTSRIGKSFIPIYRVLAQSKNKYFNERHRDWQLLRRGRYAEFNLALDRGTRFGLESNGRTESILMSLPPLAAWKYDYSPDKNTDEYITQQYLIKGINWLKTN